MNDMRVNAEPPSGARRRRGWRAAVMVCAAVTVAAAIPLLAGCRVTFVAATPVVVNPFVGTWTVAVPGQRITYRFGKDERYERDSTSSSRGASIRISVSGAYAYDSGTSILSLTPASDAIAPERFSYQFPKRDELVLTTYPRGTVNVTYTFRRQT